MENNRDLIYHVMDPTQPDDIYKNKWKELQSLLHSCGTGPQKTISQWQTVNFLCIIHTYIIYNIIFIQIYTNTF